MKNSRSTRVINAPAPWQLQGESFLMAFHCNAAFLNENSFLPPALAKTRKGRMAYVMFVDYSSSDAGPYSELLFIPGKCLFPDGKYYLTISRIFVSTMDSVVNGRNNWGIPKELADFNIHHDEKGNTAVSVSSDGELIARLGFRSWPGYLPLTGKLVPGRLRTLAQLYDGNFFRYAPVASGETRLARLQEKEFNNTWFPDLSGQRLVFCTHLQNFNMTFPVAVTGPASEDVQASV